MKKPIRKKGAAILIVVLFFVVLSVTILIGISMPITQQIENATDFLASRKTYNVADMQAENTLYRFNKGQTNAPARLSILGASADATLTDMYYEKQVSIEGISNEFQRFIKTVFAQQATGASFNYGLQIGVGGLEMKGSSRIDGNVYSNGKINGNGGPGWSTTRINGNAVSASMSDPVSSIQNIVPISPLYNQSIGLNPTQQDFAESFVMPADSILKIELYMKKTGSPSDATLKIVNDNYGVPGVTTLSSGVISASSVLSTYSNVSVTMSSASLVPGTTYWIVVDAPSDNTANYYSIGLNDSVYTSGNAKMGKYGFTWSNLSISTTDAGFRIYTDGQTGKITNVGVGILSGGGEVWAKEVNNTTATSFYCKNGTGNNGTCNTSKNNPLPIGMPISAGNIENWKKEASGGGSTSTVVVNGTKSLTIGSVKIIGDLKVESSGKLYLKGPIYVTGNVQVSGNGKIYVDSSMGATSGLIISDGVVTIGGSGGIYGSGSVGSYVVVITTSSCPEIHSCSNGSAYAMKISGASGSVALVALDGFVQLESSVKIKSLVAKTVTMLGTSNISYDSGLADIHFSSSSSGTWTASSWKEVLGL